MKSFFSILLLLCVCAISEGHASTITLSQGSGPVSVSTDSGASPDLTQSTRQIQYTLQSTANKITFTLPDGASFYVTNVTEYQLGPGSAANVIGIPSSPDAGYMATINAIVGLSSAAQFKVYDGLTDTLLFDVIPDYGTYFGGSSGGSPVVSFEYLSGNLTVRFGTTPGSTSITTAGLPYSNIFPSVSLSTFATYSLSVPPSSVPTLSEWAQLMLALMVIGVAWQFHNARERSC